LPRIHPETLSPRPRALEQRPMFVAQPPADVSSTAITVDQQNDLDCLSIGAVMGKSAGGSGISPWASRLVRVYLGRLQRSDGSRDWLSMTIPSSAMSYGWFLRRMDECETPLRPVRRARAPAATP
jgi:hypothetical protein